MRLVVGDRLGDGVDVGAVEPPHGDFHHPELLRGLEARVAGDHLAGAACDDGLLPAEAAQARGDVGDRGVVLTRVGRGAEQTGGQDELDRRRERLRHRNSRRTGKGAAWSSELGAGARAAWILPNGASFCCSVGRSPGPCREPLGHGRPSGGGSPGWRCVLCAP